MIMVNDNLMEHQNELLHMTRIEGLDAEDFKRRKIELKLMQRRIYDETRVTIEKWAKSHAERISLLTWIEVTCLKRFWRRYYLPSGL
mmetsp:Transcript_12750/g.21937  ORF Transcript_12750/g.21937 Transcript_12750/m.21937 type:complete len:87 (-) Transcript_12750:672-932(-)